MKKWLLAILLLMRPICAETSLDGVSEFGWHFFQTAAKNNGNTVFSPYSIYSCMAMTAAGAKGSTLSEMQKTFHFPSNITKLSEMLSANNASLKDHLKIANSLWIAPQFTILPEFSKTIEDKFHASLKSIDFSDAQTATDTINTWIGNNTDQKITDLLAPDDIQASTRLVLTNALYFSGKFLRPFNARQTSVESFWVDTDSMVKIPLMKQIASFFYTEDDVFQTIALPLEATQVALVVFLPKERTFTGLSSLLDGSKFKKAIESLEIQKVRLALPKFSFKQRFDLQEILTQLGLATAFSPHANFSGIDGKEDLFLSKVVHEAYFAVDENGIVAAAATAASMNVKSVLVENMKEFIADHPFIYALVDLQTKVPLFIGELSTPP